MESLTTTKSVVGNGLVVQPDVSYHRSTADTHTHTHTEDVIHTVGGLTRNATEVSLLANSTMYVCTYTQVRNRTNGFSESNLKCPSSLPEAKEKVSS